MKPKKLLSLLLSLALVVGMLPLVQASYAASPLPNFNGTADGVISWDHVPDADYYDIMKLSAGSIPIRKNASGAVDQACTEWTDQGVTFNLVKYMDLSGTFKAGTYNITINAVRNFTTMGIASTFQFQYTPAQNTLDKPKNPVWSGTTARWSAVPNATAYIVALYDYTSYSQKSLKSEIVTDIEYTFDKSLFTDPSHFYYFTVKAIADNYITSETGRSDHQEGKELLDPPATPHTITVDDGTADKSTAKAGETVTISANEKENFTFTGWTAYTEDARSISFADRLSPNTTFIMPDCDVRMMPNYKYSGSVFTDFYVNITPPGPGEHPQAPTVNTDDYSVSAYNWIRITDSESRKMTASDVFEEGIFYQCRVDLQVKDGIVGEADELKGYVNGSTKTDGMDVMISRNGSFKVKVIGSYNCHSAKTNPFVDVSESDYYYEPVLWAVDKGITNGTDATHFSPAATCTRGQVVTFLWRAAGSPTPTSTTNPFTDVTPSDYYYNAVLWAVGKNITNGTSATTFGPNAGCTRGQVVTFLHRFENSPKPSSSANPFVDVSSSEYYYDPVLWAVDKGITNGTDATHFSPNDTCTRGQIVTFLYRDMD